MEQVQELKALKSKASQLDAFDMHNFCQFFKNLYKEPTLPNDRLVELQIDINQVETGKLHTLLDEDISLEEFDDAIERLKPGKAVAEDTIANELLKSLRPVTKTT